MEEKHKARLLAEFTTTLPGKPLHVLDIPDDYNTWTLNWSNICRKASPRGSGSAHERRPAAGTRLGKPARLPEASWHEACNTDADALPGSPATLVSWLSCYPEQTTMLIAHTTDLSRDDDIAFACALALAVRSGARLSSIHAAAGPRPSRELPRAATLLSRWSASSATVHHEHIVQPSGEDPSEALVELLSQYARI
jgi:hypothetical protein